MPKNPERKISCYTDIFQAIIGTINGSNWKEIREEHIGDIIIYKECEEELVALIHDWKWKKQRT